MEKIFYIGSLKIRFITDFEFVISYFDQRFTKQILPITKEVLVDVHSEYIQEINAPSYYHADGVRIFFEEEKEYRIYEKKKEYGIMSSFDRFSNVQVCVPKRKETLQNIRPWFYIHLEELLLLNQALILHSASIEYAGKGILFCGPSGVGKTTQTNLWRKELKNVSDINGDRTVLQFFENKWYACGFPICGSSIRCEQKATPLETIILLKQGVENHIRKIGKTEKVLSLYKEVTSCSFSREYADCCLNLLSKLVESIEVIEYSCNTSHGAVDVLHKYLFEGNEHGII